MPLVLFFESSMIVYCDIFFATNYDSSLQSFITVINFFLRVVFIQTSTFPWDYRKAHAFSYLIANIIHHLISVILRRIFQ